MKTALVLAALMLVASGCAPQALASGESAAGRENDAHQLAETTEAPALHLLRVQQYQDRMPGDDAGPRLVTLVQFEVDACKPLYDGDVSVKAVATGSAVKLTVSLPAGTCENPTRQTLTGSTNLVKSGHRVMIQNPVLIEMLAAAE